MPFFFFYHGTRGTFVAGYEVHCADVRLVYYVECDFFIAARDFFIAARDFFVAARDFFIAVRGSVVAVCAVRLLRNMLLVHCGMRGSVLPAV